MNTITYKQVFELYEELSSKDKILFARMYNQSQETQKIIAESKRLQIATDLQNAGIDMDWIKKHILR